MSWHWLSSLWFNYCWPSLKGNGPEAAIQTLVYALAAYLLIPPVRKFVNSHIKGLHSKLDAQHEERLRQAEVHHSDAIKLAKAHHEAHLKALKQPGEPLSAPTHVTAKKAPVKKTPVRKPQ